MIVVFGSINIDFVTPVRRLPASGETVAGGDYILLPGGKGANQALAARRAGAEVMMVGAVGRDAFAPLALENLDRDGVGLDHLAEVEAPTGAAFIAVDEAGANQIVVASGANAHVRAAALDALAPRPDDVLLMQREIEDSEIVAAMAWARRHRCRIVFNAAPSTGFPMNALDHVDVLIANEHEAAEIAALAGLDARQTASIGPALAARTGALIVLTSGVAGAAAWQRATHWHCPALPVEPVDTTGAGDAFCGAFAAAFAEGLPVETALRFGTIAGSLACLGRGAQTSLPRRADILAHLERNAES